MQTETNGYASGTACTLTSLTLAGLGIVSVETRKKTARHASHPRDPASFAPHFHLKPAYGCIAELPYITSHWPSLDHAYLEGNYVA